MKKIYLAVLIVLVTIIDMNALQSPHYTQYIYNMSVVNLAHAGSIDHFSFSFNKAKSVGFFAVNRGENDDIHRVDPSCNIEVIVNVTNAKTGKVLADARVAVLMEVSKDKKGKKMIKKDWQNDVQTKNSTADGLAHFTVDCGKSYVVSVSKDGYESGVFTIEKTENGPVTIAAALKQIVMHC